MQLFRQTRLLVALHGAGLTNMLHRRGLPLFVLELHAKGYVSKDMANLCLEYGYAHAQLPGKTLTRPAFRSNYQIDIGQLEDQVRQMVQDVENGENKAV